MSDVAGHRGSRSSLVSSDNLQTRSRLDKRKSLPASGAAKASISPQITIAEEE